MRCMVAWAVREGPGGCLMGQLVHPFDDLRQHQVDIFADDGAVDEVDRLPRLSKDGAAVRPGSGPAWGHTSSLSPGQRAG